MAPRSGASTITISSMPAVAASSTAYWMMGRSTIGSISLATDLVAGSMRVPSPAARMTARRTLAIQAW